MSNAAETVTIDNLWQAITSHQGETFYTKKMLPFTYTIKGGEMFTDRRERSITRSTFENAYKKNKKCPRQNHRPQSIEHVRRPICVGSFGKGDRYLPIITDTLLYL